MVCERCRNTIEDWMNYCPHCGAKLVSETYCHKYNGIVKLEYCVEDSSICEFANRCPICRPYTT